MLKRIKRAMDCILATGTFLSMAGLVIVVVIQIVGRKFLAAAPAWTEEAARFFFLFSVAFGAALAAGNREFIAVDILYRRLPNKVSAVLQAVVWCLIGIFMLLVSGASVSFFQLGLVQRSPSLGISMAVVHGAMLLLSGTTALYAFLEVIRNSKQIRKQGLTP
ncbi:MAG: TRAP transporter small permease [Sedimentisphaerales bacterium]|nr:TRAP transporter small permease [Sedimentisphaerales bacterium]